MCHVTSLRIGHSCPRAPTSPPRSCSSHPASTLTTHSMAEGSSSAARVVEEQILKAAAEKVPMQLLWMEYESSDMAQVETLAPVGIEAVHLLHLLVSSYTHRESS